MASKIERLKDNDGNIIYPLTSLDAVYYSDNQTAKQYIDAKADESSYTLPAATSSTLGGVKVGSNITNSSGTISITKANVTSALGYTPPTTDTTYNDMTGATASAAGTHGLVPAPTAGANTKFLRGDGTWQAVAAGGDTTWKNVKTEGQFYKSGEAPSSTTVGKYDGYFYATRVYNAVYNDYAELFHCVRPVSVGHLAYATKEGVTCAGKPKTAIGIVSDCYGHLLGGEGNPDDPNFVPIAVSGRVPLEIKGNIEIGDMVQATKNGLGKRAHRFTNRNKIIGKVVGLDPKGRNNYMEVLVGGA